MSVFPVLRSFLPGSHAGSQQPLLFPCSGFPCELQSHSTYVESLKPGQVKPENHISSGWVYSCIFRLCIFRGIDNRLISRPLTASAAAAINSSTWQLIRCPNTAHQYIIQWDRIFIWPSSVVVKVQSKRPGNYACTNLISKPQCFCGLTLQPSASAPLTWLQRGLTEMNKAAAIFAPVCVSVASALCANRQCCSFEDSFCK